MDRSEAARSPEQGQSAKLSSGGIRHGERGAKDRRSGHAEKDGGIDKAMHLDSHKSGHQHSSSPTDGQDGKEKKEGWAKAGDQEDVRSRGEGHTDSNAEQERRRRRSLSRSMGKSKGRNGDKHSEERWSSKRSRTEEDNAKEETLEPESRPQSSSGGSRERRRSSDSVSHRASDPPAPTGLASNSHKRGYGGAHSHARAPDGPGGRRSSDSGKERRGSMDAQEQAAVGNGKSRNNGIASERQEEDHMVADSDRKASDSAAIASKPSPPRAAAPAGPKAAAAATGGASTSKPSPPSTAAPAGPKAAVAAAGGVVASKQRRLLSFEDEEDGGEDAGTKFSLSASTSSRFQKERASRPLTSAIDVSASLVSWTPSRLASALGATPVAASAAGGGPSAVRPSNRITLGGEADAEMPRSASISGQGKMLGHMVYGVATARNVRPYMEDRHTVVQSLRPLSITGQPINDGVERSFASVYDGHNGSRSAELAASRLHMSFAADPALRTHTGCLGPPAMQVAEEEAIGGALRRAFRDIDELILQSARADGGRDGSTALVVARLGDTLYSAWAGDSRAVISRSGVAERLTEDHKPQLPLERSRVEANGGRVEFQRCWRVIVEPREGRPGSGLAVSRALGDIDFKEPRRFVESEPDVKRLVPKPGDSFVVLASDGLWDVLSDQESVDCVEVVLKGCPGWSDSNFTSSDAKIAAEALLALSIKKGTVDNVTVVIQLLHWV